MRKLKRRALLLGLAAFIGLSLSSCSKTSGPESEFKELFGDLSCGVPQYQTFSNFFRPADALKGDVCNADFSQTDSQFRAFAARLGVDPAKIMSSNMIWIKADSKMDPKYPWMLNVEAHRSSSGTNGYEIHIEGRQPYN